MGPTIAKWVAMRILVTLLLLSAASCNQAKPTAAPDPALGGLPPSAPGATPTAPAAPMGDKARAAEAPAGALAGTVLEKIDTPDYSYLRLRTAGGETWAAVNASAVEIGAKVTVANPMQMDGFESKTLKRKFDRIVFGTLAAGATAAAPAPGGASHATGGNPHAAAGATTPEAAHAAAKAATNVGDVKVTKATGAEAATVSEVLGKKAALAGKAVKIHAKVVKYTSGVLGKNWLHVRDGSGSEAKGDHDLTVTTNDESAVGQVVTVRGTVSLDRDFGAGYAYPVLVENARVEKEK